MHVQTWTVVPYGNQSDSNMDSCMGIRLLSTAAHYRGLLHSVLRIKNTEPYTRYVAASGSEVARGTETTFGQLPVPGAGALVSPPSGATTVIRSGQTLI